MICVFGMRKAREANQDLKPVGFHFANYLAYKFARYLA
jgi:hypothetical protein